MPNMDGLEATRQIREITAYRHTPITTITGNAYAEDKQRCLAAGINDFLTKPIYPEVLLATWLRCMGRIPGKSRACSRYRNLFVLVQQPLNPLPIQLLSQFLQRRQILHHQALYRSR